MKSTVAAIAFSVVATVPAFASDSTARLTYLSSFDQDAIQMLSCADMMTKDKSRFYFMDKKAIAEGATEYRLAGRAAVVRAALEAPSVSGGPKIANISFVSRDATAFVTSDLRVHEDKAAAFVQNIRASGFDVSSTCTDPAMRAKAAGLNDWFARDTSVLKDVN